MDRHQIELEAFAALSVEPVNALRQDIVGLAPEDQGERPAVPARLLVADQGSGGSGFAIYTVNLTNGARGILSSNTVLTS